MTRARLPLTLIRLPCALLLAVLCVAAPSMARSQSPRPAVVVQVAGATFYLDIGTDAGVRTGDTLSVRRSRDSAPVGALHVVGATSRRSVLTFAGPGFPVTRGDTLFITPRAAEQGIIATPAIAAAAARPRAPPAADARSLRVDGAFGVEMWGSHSETVGLGTDPVRTTRDVGMPAIRFNTFVSGDRSRFRLNVRAQQRTGPQSLWDRQTRVRIYEARYDRTAGPARITVGRFFSDFDHQSAFWDGAAVRFGDERGVTAGVAAGFEPERGNEEFSATRPKAAAFVGTRHGNQLVDLVTDFAVTQAMPKDRAQWRAGADLAVRMRVGRFSISQDLEAMPPTPAGRWGISRFVLRMSVPAGPRGYVYATALSDRLTPLDTTILAPFSRRERLTSGFGLSLANGTYLDLNASVNDPSGPRQGYAAGASVSVPKAIGTGTLSLHTSWFDDGRSAGVLASPSLEYRVGTARVRGGYQFYQVDQPTYSVNTHGADLRLWQPFGERFTGVLQVTERVGHNLHSTTVFTSIEVRF